MRKILMKKILWVITVFLFGCASDPLTSALKKYEYAPVLPVSSSMYIGDIYETKGLKVPYLFMKDKLAEYIQKIMEVSG